MHEQTDAEAEITKRFHGWLNAWNASDVDAFVKYWHPAMTYFWVGGPLLAIGLDPAGMKAFYAAGFKADFTGHHIGVTVCGDAAVLTCYLAGAYTWPGGATESGTWRYSEMLVREDGGWTGLHAHFSLLAPEHSIVKS